MSGLAAFLEMGGYGAYVWPAFAVTAAVMVGLLVASLRSLRERQRTLARLEERAPAGRRRRTRQEQQEEQG